MLNFRKLKTSEIPQIDLYMDQVITIIDQIAESYKIEPNEKIMTKTMVNNYVKSGLVPKPIKKKYNTEQIMQLVMIYHLKGILTFSELDTFFKMTKIHHENSMDNLYQDFIEVHGEVLADVTRKAEELSKMEGEEQIRRLMKTIITADLNKRIAEAILKNIKDTEQILVDG